MSQASFRGVTRYRSRGIAFRMACVTAVAAATAVSSGGASAGTTAGCVPVAMSQSLQTAVDQHAPGTRFCLSAGIHRLTTAVIPKPHDTFIGRHGAVISGAKDIARLFVPSRKDWVASRQSQHNPAAPGVCNPGFPLCNAADDVYFDNKPLRPIQRLSQLAPGRVYFDHAARKIYIADNPKGHVVEAAVATSAFRGYKTAATDVTIRGLVIEKFASEAGVGAINANRRWVIEKNEVRLNHGIGVQGGAIIRNNNVHDNGELGLSIYGEDHVLVQGNTLAYNNYAGYGTSWEAGGGKFMRTSHLTVRGNYVHENRGVGIGSDSDNIFTVYEGNRIEKNSGTGLVVETSFKTLITDNVIRGNGFAFTGGLTGAGIYLNTSQNVEIVNNTVFKNQQGIGIFSAKRGSGPHGHYVTKNDYVHDNAITLMAKSATGITSDIQADFKSNNNRFQDNHYTLCGLAYFAVWNGKNGYRYADAKAWVASGFDTRSTFKNGC
jgi:parallel beta-helix repeat protein